MAEDDLHISKCSWSLVLLKDCVGENDIDKNRRFASVYISQGLKRSIRGELEGVNHTINTATRSYLRKLW